MHLARPGGVSAEPAKGGPGTDMLDKMRKAGKPVTPQMERMAAALDGMGVDDGQVRPAVAVAVAVAAGCY